MRTVIPERVARRAATNCAPGANDCLISHYSTGSHGYAQIGWHENGKRTATTAHRAAWVHHTGQQIPDGMTVDHVCHVRRCVNPAHLRLLDNVTNATDNGQGRRYQPFIWLGRTCARGHDLLVWMTGAVHCRECARDRARKKYPARWQRRKEAAATPGG